MKQLILNPRKSVSGEVYLPGSKSLTNRALLLSALAAGSTTLTNLLKSDDTDQMIRALGQLGVAIDLDEKNNSARITGNNGLFDPPANKTFFLGNAGTAIRPLTAVLAMIPGEFTVDGDQYMQERPIEHLVDALQQLGVSITYLKKSGCPPILICGGNDSDGKIKGGKVSIRGDISSQYLTSLLMALPLASGSSEIQVLGEQVSKPYLDITLNVMSRFGVQATHENYQHFFLNGNCRYQSPGTFLIEGDASSASYFFGAAAICGGPVRVHGIGRHSVQGDLAFLDTIEKMGARVERSDDWVEVSGGKLKGIDVDLNHIPDAAMTLATMALFATGRTTIRNIYNWRVKETDRNHAMTTELRKLGATVESGGDYIQIDPPEELLSATIDTYGDHRIAMAFSLAALGDKPITINDPDCTKKTFPDYFSVFDSIAH